MWMKSKRQKDVPKVPLCQSYICTMDRFVNTSDYGSLIILMNNDFRWVHYEHVYNGSKISYH